MKTIDMKDVFPPLKLESAMGYRNLTVVPCFGGWERYQNYLLASEALGSGHLRVTETSSSGTVPELLAFNLSHCPILLIDGEELQGAKQNRILNTTVFLAPASKTRVPVSCVEEGRWNHVSDEFKSGHYSPVSLRQRKSRDVQLNLRTRGCPESDQGAVWACVSEQVAASGGDAPTRALSDALDAQADVLARYHEALPYPEGACGVVAAVAGGFVAADVFDSPTTLEVLWPRLIASYAFDAEATDLKADKTFSTRAAAVILEHVKEQKGDTFDSVGLGRDLRFEADDLIGQGLVVGNRLLHLSIFPSTFERPVRTRSGPRFRPPSQRRR